MIWPFVLLVFGAVALVATRSGEKEIAGASGRRWLLRTIVHNGPAELVEVKDKELDTMIIRYVEQGRERFLAAAAPTLLARVAMQDLSVQGPVGPGATPEKKNEPPPNPSPMVPAGKVRVEPGTYEANVEVPFPASLVVTVGNLRDGIAGKGFSQVFVTDERPPGWSLPGDPDYFVRVSWQRPAELFDRPKAVSNFRKVN